MNNTKSLMTEAFPSSEPTDELADRIGRLTPRQPRRTPWIALGSAIAAAGGLAAVGLLSGAPRLALADEILQQTKNIHGHLLTYIVGPDGRRTLSDECWLEADRARTISHEGNGLDQLLDLSKNLDVSWNPFLHAFVFRESDLRQEFSLGRAIMTGDLDILKTLPGFHKAPERTGRSEFNGKAADYLEIDLPSGKWTVFADPITHRTLGVRMFHQESIPDTEHVIRKPGSHMFAIASENHLVEREVVIEEQVADPAVFLPIFTVAGERIDAVAKREEVRERLSHVIATYPSPRGPVEIRDVSMNAHGDVFVLWTGGNGPYGTNVIPMAVQDATGGKYAKSWGTRPSGGQGPDWPGYSFDGKPLEGAWFAHVDGPVATGALTIGFKKEFEPMEKMAFHHTQWPARTSGVVPDYMMFMSMPLNPTKVGEMADLAAAQYFTDTAKDYPRAEAMWRKVIAETEHRSDQQRWNSHFELGMCLEHERRYAQAIEQLTLAATLAGERANNADSAIGHEVRVVKRMAGMEL